MLRRNAVENDQALIQTLKHVHLRLGARRSIFFRYIFTQCTVVGIPARKNSRVSAATGSPASARPVPRSLHVHPIAAAPRTGELAIDECGDAAVGAAWRHSSAGINRSTAASTNAASGGVKNVYECANGGTAAAAGTAWGIAATSAGTSPRCRLRRGHRGPSGSYVEQVGPTWRRQSYPSFHWLIR